MLHLLHLDGEPHAIAAARVEIDWRFAGHAPCDSPLASHGDERWQMLMSFEDGSTLFLQSACEPGAVGYRLHSPRPYRWRVTQHSGIARVGWEAC